MSTAKSAFDWRKYILAFVITGSIFGTAFYFAIIFNNQRIANIRTTESQLSIDLLSNETQYELLGEQSCSDIAQNPILSDQLNAIASRLSYTEDNLGSNNPDVIALKEQYSLLEIKDYLLMQKVTVQCGTHPTFILYFYSNTTGACPDCEREGDVLTYLRETYPTLRVYSFDYDINLSAVKTLIAMRKISPALPAIVINNRPAVYGFKSVDDMLSLAPEIKIMASSTSATSTIKNRVQK